MISIKKKKPWLKLLFVIAIIGVIIYTFRDQAGPILAELEETSPWIVLLICLSSCGYELMEGMVTWTLATKYNPGFQYKEGVESAFYCSFYRVATLGSGSGVAAVFYFNQKGIEVFKGTGMYMVEYVLHKISIAVFSGILFVMSWSFMRANYNEYSMMLLGGYGLTVLIAGGLLLFCVSKKFHRFLICLADKMNRKGKWDEKILTLKQQCLILEDASAFLLKNGKLILVVLLEDLVKLSFWYGIPFLVIHNSTEITLVQTLAVTSLAVMIAAVLPAPAGIGSTEFVLTALLAVLIGTGQAGSVTLLYRFATFVFPFLVGLLVVLDRRRRERKLGKLCDEQTR